MNDSKKAKGCLQLIVDLFKEGNSPRAYFIITNQEKIKSEKFRFMEQLANLPCECEEKNS